MYNLYYYVNPFYVSINCNNIKFTGLMILTLLSTLFAILAKKLNEF